MAHLLSRPLLCAFAAAAALVFAAAHAAEAGSDGYAIGAREGWSLSVSGAWATQCPPTLENVALQGNDLRIDARSVLGLCTRQTTPFAIEVNPAAALNQPPLVPGIYHVSFFAADGAQAPQKLRAFSLVDRSAAQAARVVPETGFWWSAENTADRTLLSIELQNDQLSVALMSYDRSGQPQWHFGAAPYNGRIAHVPLLRLQGGNEIFAPEGDARASGESSLALDLEFHTGAHATAWLSRAEGDGDEASLRLRSFEAVRLPLAATVDGGALQGDWVLVDDAGARKLHLDQFRVVDSEHFELADSAGGVTLACTRDSAQPDMPPSACTLRTADRAAPNQFDSIAITRMDGAGAHLLRVTK